MRGSYERMDIVNFGSHLLNSEDLDPIYVALNGLKGQWSDEQIQRWLVAYWCFYNAGVACHMSELSEPGSYWNAMMTAAVNEQPNPFGDRWARGHERRHFRGKQGIDAISELRDRHPNRPEEMAVVCMFWGQTSEVEFSQVSKTVQSYRGFGPWIGFKVADMAERVAGTPVNFDEAAVFMFKDPVKAALRLWRESNKLPETAKPKSKTDQERIIHGVVEYLAAHLGHRTAPPTHERSLNIQEYETILCKWKSHMNGHYPLFNDTIEIRDGLLSWVEHCGAAGEFLEQLPKGPEE